MIRITENVATSITEHAERDYPHECGGMLIGRFEEGKKTVLETFPLENAREEEAGHDRGEGSQVPHCYRGPLALRFFYY